MRRRLFAAAPIDDAAGNDGGDGCPAQRPAIEGRVATLRLRAGGLKCPLKIGINDRHVAPSARTERAAILEAEDARGLDGAEFDEPFETNDALMHKPVERETNRRLKPRDAVWRVIVFERLLVCVMWRVVCGDGVNRAVG